MKIGYPRAVHYYDYFPFWAGFFRGLDLELVTSPLTNRKVLERGLKKASDDTCLPIKLLTGHIQALGELKVDALFLPRMVSVEARTYLCPKLLGLPESVLTAVPEGLRILTLDLNARHGQRQVWRALREFAVSLGKTPAEARQGYMLAQTWQKRYESMRREGRSFIESMSEFDPRLLGEVRKPEPTETSDSSTGAKRSQFEDRAAAPLAVGRILDSARSESNRMLKIALVGHSYLTQETYANLNLVKKLEERAEVRFIEEVMPATIAEGLQGLRKSMFWSHARKILGAGISYVHNEAVDGIIYLTCFGCGTDSMSQDMVARIARQQHKPYMVLTLDEHSGEAGLVTRLEAFLDMTERRAFYESDLSAHG